MIPFLPFVYFLFKNHGKEKVKNCFPTHSCGDISYHFWQASVFALQRLLVLFFTSRIIVPRLFRGSCLRIPERMCPVTASWSSPPAWLPLTHTRGILPCFFSIGHKEKRILMCQVLFELEAYTFFPTSLLIDCLGRPSSLQLFNLVLAKKSVFTELEVARCWRQQDLLPCCSLCWSFVLPKCYKLS